jgi:hypothetical protein
MHLLITHGHDRAATVAGRLKTRVRQAVGRGRIWTAGYDKRYCFTDEDVYARIRYIQRHAGHRPIGRADGAGDCVANRADASRRTTPGRARG